MELARFSVKKAQNLHVSMYMYFLCKESRKACMFPSILMHKIMHASMYFLHAFLNGIINDLLKVTHFFHILFPLQKLGLYASAVKEFPGLTFFKVPRRML